MRRDTAADFTACATCGQALPLSLVILLDSLDKSVRSPPAVRVSKEDPYFRDAPLRKLDQSYLVREAPEPLYDDC